MTGQDLERELNPQQIEAVTHGPGPQLVLAGAGSGKTRVITYRIAWLIRERHIDPHRIAAVTFTNKAAAEMRERVESLLQLYPLPTFVGTFHRYALGMLRRWGERVRLKRDFVIMDAADQRSLIKKALEAEGLSEKSFSPRAVLGAISSAKNRLVEPEEFESQASTFFHRRIAPVYRRYQGLLRQDSGVDFDDMIALAVRLLEKDEEICSRIRRRLEYLLVDEYQDTNHAQLRLIRGLIGEEGNLTAVGDEDQSIYSWRGADLNNILDFEKSFPGATVRKLERNYRSTQNILDASGALVARNERRRGKRLWTEAGAGEKIEVYQASDEADEARWVVNTLQQLRGRHPLQEMAILVRTNAQTRSLEEVLLEQEVPYTLVGGTRFYERAEIKDLVAYLRILRNPRETFSLLRILNQPPRGIGKATREQLWDEASRIGQPVWDLIYLRELGPFSTRATNAVLAFRDQILRLQEAARELPLPALLDRLLDETGYADLYDPEDPDDLARRENIQEFLSAAQEFAGGMARRREGSEREEADSLTQFLDHVSLVSDIDSWQAEVGVSLMTLHSAKGLEFPVVFVSGLEDGLLPHFNAQGAPEDIEEERRLLYVGMTRAKTRLLMTHCRRRRIAGHYQDQEESPFLQEIPADLLQTSRSPELFSGTRAGAVYSYFGRAPRARPPFADPAAGETAIERGHRVRHPTLGPGVVLDTEGSGPEAKLTIFFERSGKRRLLARYANLELL